MCAVIHPGADLQLISADDATGRMNDDRMTAGRPFGIKGLLNQQGPDMPALCEACGVPVDGKAQRE